MNPVLTALAGSALPTLMVLVGILLNRNDINRLDGRIPALETSLRMEMATLRAEIGSLRSEMNAMRDRFHADMMMAMSGNGVLDARISKLEEKSGS
jgi:hypothetical protein